MKRTYFGTKLNDSNKNVQTTSDDIAPDGTNDSNWSENVDNFKDMKLKEELLRGICDNGFERPTAIQQRAILPCIKQRDLIVLAPPGTGKTVTCSIVILQRIQFDIPKCQAIILAPTHESVTHIQKVVPSLSGTLFAQGLACTCIDGTNEQKFESGCHIAVGTPDTISGMIKGNALLTEAIKIFVMDGVDELLLGDFKSQIEKVFTALPTCVQVILLSDAMSADDIAHLRTILKRNLTEIVMKEDGLPTSDSNIDVFLLLQKFRENGRKSVKKCQIRQICIDCGLQPEQKRIEDICASMNIFQADEAIDFDVFTIIVSHYNIFEKLVRGSKHSSLLTGSSSLTDDSETYKKTKKSKILGGYLGLSAFTRNAIQEMRDIG